MQSIYFDFLNKTKNEHRCSTILRSETCFVIARRFFLSGMTKGRVTNRRVMISESYVRTTPTFPNDHTQFRNSPDVSLN